MGAKTTKPELTKLEQDDPGSTNDDQSCSRSVSPASSHEGERGPISNDDDNNSMTSSSDEEDSAVNAIGHEAHPVSITITHYGGEENKTTSAVKKKKKKGKLT